MKKLIFIAISAMLIGVFASSFTINRKAETVNQTVTTAPALKWYTDFSKANALSEKTGKPIFAFFTGSDWCGWCKRLQAAVFVKENFKKWANDEVILLELDFPRRKKLPANTAKQNRELQQVFKVRGYPTVWIFKTKKDAKTNQISIEAWGQLGYPRSDKGQESIKFVADANKILATQKKAKK